MGPRLVSRGDCYYARMPTLVITGFNGAAAREPRRRCVYDPPITRRKLQWGRGS